MARGLNGKVPTLITRHRQTGISLDTNLLLLWMVGKCDPALIPRHKRTLAFSAADFELLAEWLAGDWNWTSTPNVLTETVNLLMQVNHEMQSTLLALFQQRLLTCRESYYRSSELSSDPRFPILKLTDTSLLRAAQRGRLVISVDFKLCGLINAAGGSAINFNHFRTVS